MTFNVLNGLLDDVIATQDVDMTETSAGGGGGLMPEGYAMARLVTYIELGTQPQEFGGKAKAPAPEIRLGFKLFGGQDNCYDGRYMNTFPIALGNNEKSNAKLTFDRLNWQKDMQHFAQALGRGFLLPITVHTNETTKKQTNRINLKGILPPIDPVSKGAYPIPEVTEADLKYFFFHKPTKETWESLFVEGSYDDGGSKNKDQETILKALNYPGSALEQMLSGVGGLVLPDATPTAPTAPVASTPEVPASIGPVTAPVAPVAPTAPVAPVMPPMPS